MQLLTKEILTKFEKVGSQDNKELKEQEIIVKFFNPTGLGNWYATEYNPETQIFFGWVSIYGDHCDEAGSFSLSELTGIRLPYGLHIERDKHFGEGRLLKEVMYNNN